MYCLSTIRGFPVTLENPHVVGSEQVWMGVAVSGPDNITLNSSYAHRYRLVRCYQLFDHVCVCVFQGFH